jgi:TonB family protein
MKIHFTLIAFFICSLANSQEDTIIYYNTLDSVVDDINLAIRYEQVIKKRRNYKICNFKLQKEKWKKEVCKTIKEVDKDLYSISTNKSFWESYKRVILKKIDSTFLVSNYINDKLIEQGYCTNIFPLVKTGEWLTYSPDGYLLSQDTYVNNYQKNNIRYQKDGILDISNAFNLAEEMPQFNGKDYNTFRRAISENLNYPTFAAENHISGIVLIQFVIMENGKLEGLKIIKSVHPLLDEEAIRTINKIKHNWTPGYTEGKPVRVLFTFPIVFLVKNY